jgi:hypothetical protein
MHAARKREADIEIFAEFQDRENEKDRLVAALGQDEMLSLPEPPGSPWAIRHA